MYIRAALIAGLLVASLSAQTPNTSSPTASDKPKNCTVSGKVISATDGSPLRSARIALKPEHGRSESGIYVSTSDSDGHFILKDIAPGRYWFFSSHAGFVNQYYLSKSKNDHTMLGLKAGQVVPDVMFRMTPAAAISGRVTSEDGEPLEKMRVVALELPDEDEDDDSPHGSHKSKLDQASLAQTDDRGRYRIFGLAPGEYYIRALDYYEPEWSQPDEDFSVRMAEGSQFAPIYYPGVLQLDQAQKISLLAGEEAEADFSMRHIRTVTVSGRVSGPENSAAHAYVVIEQSSADDNSSDQGHSASVDDKGNFTIRGVPPGNYTLWANGRGNGDKSYQGRQKLDIGTDNIDSLVITLGGGATIRGRVIAVGMGSPGGKYVLLSSVDDEESTEHGRVTKDGTFEVTSVPDGSYAVRVEGLEQGSYIKSARVGQDEVLQKGLTIEKGVGGFLEIVLSSDSAEIHGSVTMHDEAVVGALVRFVPDPKTPFNRLRLQRVRTDQNGHFVCAGLAPGTYRVVASSPASSASTPLKSEPQTVILIEHDKKNLTLTIMPPRAD